MPRRLKGVLPYAALFIGAAYLFHDAATFAAAARPGQLGPDFWPRAVLVLLMVVCGYEVLRKLLFDRAVAAPAAEPPQAQAAHDDEAPPASPRFPLRLGVGIALSIAYVLTLDELGFFVGTALYLALFMVTGRYYRSRVVLLSSVLGSLAFVFVFMKVVYVSLPLGVGPFRVLSVWLLALLGIR
jgi:putative tricarboxylic transport membrane protein